MGIKVPSETQGDGESCFVIPGLSFPICKMVRLGKMLSEGLSTFSLSHMVCIGTEGFRPVWVHRTDPSLDSAGGHWTTASCKAWWDALV